MINLNEKITSNVLLAANTSSTSTSTGALIVLGGAAIQGNLSIGGNIFLNQGLIGGNTSNYSDANVSAFLAAYGSNTVVTTGNITAGNVAGTTFTGNLEGRVLRAVQAGITTLGTLTNVNTNGNVNVTNTVNTGAVIASGNITGNNVIASYRAITTPTVLANLIVLAGARAFATDANLAALNNFGAPVSGGAGNTVPVYSDGVKWYIG